MLKWIIPVVVGVFSYVIWKAGKDPFAYRGHGKYWNGGNLVKSPKSLRWSLFK